jgi:hypothetical protein
MSDNKKTGFGRYGKGYYIALVLCAAAIGITSYVYYRNTEDALRDPEVLLPAMPAEAPAALRMVMMTGRTTTSLGMFRREKEREKTLTTGTWKRWSLRMMNTVIT